jgi:hypothetical protein
VKVGIYNLNSDSLDSNNSLSNISLLLDHGSLKGLSLVQVQAGVATFTNLSINALGTYQLTASSENLESVTYSEKLTVSKLELSLPGNITSYFEFELKVLLLTQKGEKYMDEETLTLESNLTIIGNPILQAINGTASFKVYTNQNGPAWFKVYVGEIKNQVEVNIENPITRITVKSELV